MQLLCAFDWVLISSMNRLCAHAARGLCCLAHAPMLYHAEEAAKQWVTIESVTQCTRWRSLLTLQRALSRMALSLPVHGRALPTFFRTLPGYPVVVRPWTLEWHARMPVVLVRMLALLSFLASFASLVLLLLSFAHLALSHCQLLGLATAGHTLTRALFWRAWPDGPPGAGDYLRRLSCCVAPGPASVWRYGEEA